MQEAKLNLNNGLTVELFSSDPKKIRHLIKSCGKIVQTRLWGIYVRLDDNDTYQPGLLKDRLSTLVRIENEVIFLVMAPWQQDPVALQREVDGHGPSELWKFVEFVAYNRHLYSTTNPTGKLIMDAVINNLKPTVYALMNK